MFQYLCRKFTTYSLKSIGQLTTTNYDHSTILNSIASIVDIIFLKHRSENYSKVESAILRMQAYTGKVIL